MRHSVGSGRLDASFDTVSHHDNLSALAHTLSLSLGNIDGQTPQLMEPRVTMPDERLRSLSWGFDLLSELVADLDVPGDLRDRAASLSILYPSPAALVQLMSDDAKTMPPDLADAIEDAGALFRDVQASGGGNGATRRGVLYTLRHFPMPGVAKRWAERGFGDGIASWLAR